MLAAVLLAVATATPAFARGVEVAPPDGSAPPRDDRSLYPGAYDEMFEKGALIYGGDVEYRCGDLLGFGGPAEPGSGDVTADGGVVGSLTREAVELCAEAGFTPEGATLGAPASSGGADDGGRRCRGPAVRPSRPCRWAAVPAAARRRCVGPARVAKGVARA